MCALKTLSDNSASRGSCNTLP